MQNDKKVEEALRESEERYRFMFENNPQPMFIYDLETLAFLQANKTAVEHYGYSKQEFLNMTLKDLHLEEDLELLTLDIEKTKHTSNPTGEWRQKKKSGEIIYVEIVAQTVTFNNRIVRHILINDITKHRQTENALKNSESRLRLFFNISSDALFLLDEDGQFIDANQVAISRYGYSLDEFLRMTPLDIAANSLKGKVQQQVIKASQDEIFFEWTHCTKGGIEFPVEVHSKPAMILGKKCMFVEARDITERKKNEAKFIDIAAQWQITFDTVKDGVCLLDSNQRIIRCNKVMTELFPQMGKNMIGRKCWEVVHGIKEPLNECPILKMKKTLQRENIELKVESKWLDITVDPIFDVNNSYTGAVHIVRDITERKLAEEALTLLNNQLKSTNSTKDKLFSIVAHDLKNPFNAILGFSELLVNNHNSYNHKKTEEFIEQINSAAKNTLALIDNLLVWANSQMGKIEYQPQNLRLLTTIQDTLDLLRSTARIKNITIRYFEAEDIAVYADKIMLQIIVRNLISNAIKFTKPNGKINIYATIDHNYVEITVSDDGIGISKEICNKLFNRNDNITTNGTANEKGSGLGLMLCKEFIEKHGGKIWVESELGVGSEFKFTLPKG
ncbi:MAG: PAS domain-containing sensor histidine kinase [Bacteroidales bacterium]|nr:MAG: PAS domain-containing sensor histidine kinase [Bacteroidales bacterium]